MTKQGLYRSEDTASGAKYVRLKCGDAGEVDMSEEQYRAEGYKPDFDDLLSQEEYNSASPAAGTRGRPDKA
jgi:hypothetical protein